MIYRMNAHNVLTGTTQRATYTAKSRAIGQAKAIFNCGDFLWVDVVAEDKRGRITFPFHVERKPTDAERAAILGRYSIAANGARELVQGDR
jgi:hypothetical protein